jgi:hypothetical protein
LKVVFDTTCAEVQQDEGEAVECTLCTSKAPPPSAQLQLYASQYYCLSVLLFTATVSVISVASVATVAADPAVVFDFDSK